MHTSVVHVQHVHCVCISTGDDYTHSHSNCFMDMCMYMYCTCMYIFFYHPTYIFFILQCLKSFDTTFLYHNTFSNYYIHVHVLSSNCCVVLDMHLCGVLKVYCDVSCLVLPCVHYENSRVC